MADQVSPFTVGLILPLTGPLAEYGIAMKNCIELARQDSPQNFGNIKLVYEDAAYDPKQAVSAFQKLAAADKPQLIYTFGVAFCKVLAPLAEAARIPLVGQCIDPSIARSRKFVLRFMNYTDQYMKLQAEYLDKRNLNKIGIILTENPYLEEILAALERNLSKQQKLVIVDRYPPGEMNFRSAIARLKTHNLDTVGVLLAAGQISQFYRQAREQRLDRPSFGTNFFESLSEVDSAQSAMDGAVFANNKTNPAFILRYRRTFGRESQLAFGSLAYEFTRLSGELFGRDQDPPGGEEIIRRFSMAGSREGLAAGPYGFRNHSAVGSFFDFPLVIKRVSGQDFIEDE